MGIKGLAKFLADHAPKSVRQQDFDSFTGRTIAIDASMSLYQFMIAIREGDGFQALTNEAGETTSHISGMLSRCIKLMEKGIKPVYVFDGKPPTLKTGELALRKQRREVAETELTEAQEAGDKENIKKFMGRTVKVTKQHNEDVKTLLRLMGVPIVEAPGEAEAQCAALCSSGKVFATATEDADALTFGSTNLIKNLNFSEKKQQTGSPIMIINLPTALEELGMDMDQFVDFCILCGCDYCDTIRGVGPPTAFNLVKQHGTIEKVLANMESSKFSAPDQFPFDDARGFFKQPDVTNPEDVDLTFKEPEFDKLKDFLVVQNSFNEARVDSYIARLKKAKVKSSQQRLETFFGAGTIKSSSKPKAKSAAPKRKTVGGTSAAKKTISKK